MLRTKPKFADITSTAAPATYMRFYADNTGRALHRRSQTSAAVAFEAKATSRHTSLLIRARGSQNGSSNTWHSALGASNLQTPIKWHQTKK